MNTDLQTLLHECWRNTECDECGHEMRLHEDEYGCDYEADRYEPDFGYLAWRCGCKGVAKCKVTA